MRGVTRRILTDEKSMKEPGPFQDGPGFFVAAKRAQTVSYVENTCPLR
jgi:hypothetical protein